MTKACLDCHYWLPGLCGLLGVPTEYDFYCKGFQEKAYFKIVHVPDTCTFSSQWHIEFHDSCVTKIYDVAEIRRRVQLEPLVKWLNNRILPYLLERGLNK